MIASVQPISQLGPVYGCYIAPASASELNEQKILNELNIEKVFEIQCSTKYQPRNDSTDTTFVNVQVELLDDALEVFETTAYRLLKALKPVPGSQKNIRKTLLCASTPALVAHQQAIVVALVMLAHHVDFSNALAMLHQTGSFFEVSDEVERQLRIWHFCNYSIYRQAANDIAPLAKKVTVNSKMPGSYPLSPPTSRRGSSDDYDEHLAMEVPGHGDANDIFKSAYLAWRKERAALNAAKHLSALAKRAATLARARSQRKLDLPDCGASTADIQPMSYSALIEPPKDAWRNVEDTERAWNTRPSNGTTSIPA